MTIVQLEIGMFGSPKKIDSWVDFESDHENEFS